MTITRLARFRVGGWVEGNIQGFGALESVVKSDFLNYYASSWCFQHVQSSSFRQLPSIRPRTHEHGISVTFSGKQARTGENRREHRRNMDVH